ncbi:Stress-activated map kinase-interacting protein 1-like protein [Aphelenchoides fujianensis]|nr:Stress-activated map kinase-interacting protein 1-like protein [Aphelenchoides fujianensis]
MAHFGREELIDCVRHAVALDDATGFAPRVLGRPTVRSKPGGLPLELTQRTERPEEDDPSPPFKFAQLAAEVERTSVVCRAGVLKRAKNVQNLVDARRQQKPKLDVESAREYFKPKSVPDSPRPSTSLFSQLLEQSGTAEKTRFGEFSKFEALENEPHSRTINVIFPFAARRPNETPKMLEVRVKESALVEEFIGLCCFLYTTAGFKPECASPANYSLYLADETFDFDVELPALDRHRPVADCHFTMLAMVQTEEGEHVESEKYLVSVHQTNGHRFVFELDSLNHTLEWLRDKSAQRCAEMIGRMPKMGNLRKIAYQLETLDGPDQPLKLTNTIASVGTLEFLLIRHNSSRGDFVPQMRETHDSSLRTPLFVQTKQRPADLRHAPLMSTPSNSSTASPLGKTDSPTTPVSRSNFFALGSGPIVQEYQVERLHRLKAKWAAKLAIREDCLEIVPVIFESKRKFVPQSTQKSTVLSWELVGGIEHVERNNGRRLLKIVWLPMSPEVFALQGRFKQQVGRPPRKPSAFDDFYQDAPSSTGRRTSSSQSGGTTSDSSSSKTRGMTDDSLPDSSDEATLQQLLQAYEGMSWKILQIETNDEDARDIAAKAMELVEAKRSVVRLLFANSAGGTRRVRTAAEFTFAPKEPPVHPAVSNGKRASTVGISASPSAPNLRKRMSVNPFPTFTRMFSKPDG